MDERAREFQGTVEVTGTRATVALPFDPNAAWGAKARHYVTGSVNGHKVRALLASTSDGFALPIGALWREGAGIEQGTQVDVAIWPEGPQESNMAGDITAALDASPEAKAFFESLATFYRKGYVNWVEQAKRPETRARRLAEMLEALKARKRQR